MANPALNGLDRRDHRYLQARVILANVPEFTTSDDLGSNGETGLYDTGFNYMKRWGGTFGDADRDIWQSFGPDCLDNNRNSTIGDYRTAIDSGSGFVILNWLNEYTECRYVDPKQPIFASVHNELTPYVLLAIEDQIANAPNPLRVTEANRGSAQIKKANTCFLDGSSCIEGDRKPGRGINMIDFCSQPERNCRDRPAGGYFYFAADGSPVYEPATVTVAQWLDNYSPSIIYYPGATHTDARYIAPVTDVRTQLVYRTRLGYDYALTVGLYDWPDGPDSNLDPDIRYLPMGLGMWQVPGDTLGAAFNRHWNRLNYGGIWHPQTYRPDYCINGISHVVRFDGPDGDVATWLTIVFQTNDNFAEGDNWFCGAG